MHTNAYIQLHKQPNTSMISSISLNETTHLHGSSKYIRLEFPGNLLQKQIQIRPLVHVDQIPVRQIDPERIAVIPEERLLVVPVAAGRGAILDLAVFVDEPIGEELGVDEAFCWETSVIRDS